jgi:hypothetical protein
MRSPRTSKALRRELLALYSIASERSHAEFAPSRLSEGQLFNRACAHQYLLDGTSKDIDVKCRSLPQE